MPNSSNVFKIYFIKISGGKDTYLIVNDEIYFAANGMAAGKRFAAAQCVMSPTLFFPAQNVLYNMKEKR
jgi:hypothetical protein